MNRKPILCLLLLLLPSVACALGPKIEVNETDFDFGTVLQGEKIEHAFAFHNAGDEPLLIDRVKSSCGCTAVLVSEKEIPPGGDGEVKATFDSTRFRGGVVKTIYLYSNDPTRSLVQFHLRGKVQEEIRLSSRSLIIGPLAPGQRSQAEITLTNLSRTPVTIGPVRTTARELKVDFEPTLLGPGASLTLEVIARPGEGKPVVSGYLLIRTDSSRLPEIRVPVQVRVATGAR
ncbi:uncharacterized protein DUF1573 [Geothermobacter ehrlichii]|uniref:Uncharacterized protein DUF1573 n=1 Tax=Geothermobacter ehrlichii TaxID=213224 RepID=A0A5D3WH90_9BACT|nr:DUF1573 domain-containing protein [Geothermobacter ehrlichii]TYO96343.1 uncharacterized protein DUF1573 [Geothermobacter ehrlichii]